jgi:hypothetical protein
MLIIGRSIPTLALMASLSLSARSSHAEGSGDSREARVVRIAYLASDACPPASRFMAEVSARLTRPVRFGDEPGADALEVRVEQSGAVVHAELGVAHAEAPPSIRVFELSSCEDAVVALALVAALALDPRASTTPGSALPRRVSPAGLSEAPPLTPAPRPAPTRRPAERRGSDAWTTLRWGGELAAAAAATTGPAPVALLSGGVELALTSRAESASVLAPRFALALFASRTGWAGPAIDEATFTWALLRASGCPLRFAVRAWAMVRPCLTIDAGWTTAKAADTASVDGTSASRPWVSIGPSLVAHVGHGRPFVSIGGGPLVALVRPTYLLEGPRAVVHDVPPVSWTVHLTLGFVL